jgi:hypothetical protein
MSKAGTKSAKHAKPFAAEREFARAIASEPAKPITKRRIVLASLCGTALLTALATLPIRNAATNTPQVAAAKPAPALRIAHPSIDAWAQVRPVEVTGAIAKKKKKSGKTKYMKAAEEPNPIGDWFKKTFSGDDKTARKRTSAID